MFRDGIMTEGSATNLYAVIDGSVIAPAQDHKILAGIRYGLMQALCAAAGVPYRQDNVSKAALLAADEILLSSATKEILAVTRVDDQAIGPIAGRPGPIWAKLFAAYQQEKQRQCGVATPI